MRRNKRFKRDPGLDESFDLTEEFYTPNCEGSTSHNIMQQGRELMQMLDEESDEAMRTLVFEQLRTSGNSAEVLANMIVSIANELKAFKIALHSQKDTSETPTANSPEAPG